MSNVSKLESELQYIFISKQEMKSEKCKKKS